MCNVFSQIHYPMNLADTETRRETRNWWGWVLGSLFSIRGDLFQGWKLQGKARRKRKFQGGLLDRVRKSFISYNWPKRFPFFPFLCSVPLPLYHQIRTQSLVSRKKGEYKGLWIEKRTSLILHGPPLLTPLPLCASFF